MKQEKWDNYESCLNPRLQILFPTFQNLGISGRVPVILDKGIPRFGTLGFWLNLTCHSSDVGFLSISDLSASIGSTSLKSTS